MNNRWFKTFEPHPFCEIGAAFDAIGLSDPPPQTGTTVVTNQNTPPAFTSSAADLLLSNVQAADPTSIPEFIDNPDFQPQFIEQPGAPAETQPIASFWNAAQAEWRSTTPIAEQRRFPAGDTGAIQLIAERMQREAAGAPTPATRIPNPLYDPNIPQQIVNPAFGAGPPTSSPFVAPRSQQELDLSNQLIAQASTTSPSFQAAENALIGRIGSPNAGVRAAPPVRSNPAIAPALAAANRTPPQVAAATPILSNLAQSTPAPVAAATPILQQRATTAPSQVAAASPILESLATPGELQTDTSFLEPFARGDVQTDVSELEALLSAVTDTSALNPILSGDKLIDTSALEEFLTDGSGETDISLLDPFLSGAAANPANELFLRMFEGELGGNEGMQPLLDSLFDQASTAAISRNVLAGGSGANSQELADIFKTGTQYAAPFVFDQHQKDQQLRALGAQLYGDASAQDLARGLTAAVEGTRIRAQDVINELSARGAITEARAQDIRNYLDAAGTEIGARGNDLTRQLSAAQGITGARSQDVLNRLSAAGEVAGFSGADLLRNLQAGGALGDLGLNLQSNQINAANLLGGLGLGLQNNQIGAGTALGNLGLGLQGNQIQALNVAGGAAASDTAAETQRYGINQDASTAAAAQQLQAILNAPTFQQSQIGNLLAAIEVADRTRQQQQQVIDAPLLRAQQMSSALAPLFGVQGTTTQTSPLYGPSNASILAGLGGAAGSFFGF